jgi:uncharacterized protein YfaS (alpha-2-macroglobulin family)
MKSDTDANRLINYYQPDKDVNNTNDFYNRDIANAQYLYLLAKHFPDSLQKSGKNLMTSLISEVNTDDINTLLSSYTSLALSAYAPSIPATSHQPLSISEILANNEKKLLPAQNNNYVKANIDELAKKVLFNNPSKQIYFYQVTQSGFDKNLLTKASKNHLEIARDYRDLQGKVITEATLGSEIEVHIQVRSLDDRYFGNIAIVDLLPGGFEVVNDSVKLDNLDYVDAREDRVIFFGSITPDVKEIVYRIKAINTGKFIVPPIFANSMYDPSVNAHSVVSNILVIG